MALDITIYDPTGAELWTRSVPIGMIEQWAAADEDHPLTWGGAWRAPAPVLLTEQDIDRVELYALRSVCICATCSLCRTFSRDLVQTARSAPPNSTIEAI